LIVEDRGKEIIGERRPKKPEKPFGGFLVGYAVQPPHIEDTKRILAAFPQNKPIEPEEHADLKKKTFNTVVTGFS